MSVTEVRRWWDRHERDLMIVVGTVIAFEAFLVLALLIAAVIDP